MYKITIVQVISKRIDKTTKLRIDRIMYAYLH